MPVHDFDRITDRRGGDSVKWNSYPPEVLPMWVADADFLAPEPVTRALAARVEHGVFGYSNGLEPAFRRAVSHWMGSRFGWSVDPDRVAFSPTVVISLVLCVQTFTQPGDAVLFFTPSYPPFFSVPQNNGRQVLCSSLTTSGGNHVIDFDDFAEKAARPSTKLLLLCNPHNPTGRAFTREELTRIGEICLEHGVLVVADEIHCDYVHPGREHLPFASLSDAFALNCLTAVNPSKTFNIADLHCSALISANPELLTAFTGATQRMALHSNALGMRALIAAYTQSAYYADGVNAYTLGNIRLAVERINSRTPGIRAYEPEATFLLWLDCRGLGLSQAELEDFFVKDAKLALNTGTAFGPEGEGFMRMNLACPRSTVEEALDRLERAARRRTGQA